MTITLSTGARASLDAICDTFVPGESGLPSATEIGVPDVILEAIGANPSADVRDGFAGLIEGWDPEFAARSQADRERVLLGWCDSDDVMQRAAFQALRKLAMVMYYTIPWQGEGRNPVDEAIGYPGPLGPPKDPPPKTIKPLQIREDTELDCDVVVVGSGAGGGTAAGVLAKAGLDVVVIEAGGYFSEEDFDGAELNGYVRLYLGGGGVPTPDQSIGLLAGFCLGGGTTVNYTWCFRPPDHVRQDWKDRFSLDEWVGEDFDQSLEAVWDRIHVNSENSMPSLRDERFREGLTKLGWDSQVMQRNVQGCSEEICGHCHYGCPIGAKQSTFKTWLQDAYDAGARIVVNAPVERVLIEGGEAKGVEARTIDGHKLTVRARAVAAAAGALNTPALLVRSGLGNPNVGKNLMIHPVLLVWAIFEQEVLPWTGVFGSTFCDEFLDMGEGYGVKYMHASAHPSDLAVFAPWRGAGESAELMQGLRYTGGFGALQRARDAGEVVVGDDGLPAPIWHLSDFDREIMRKGLDGMAQVLEAGGARRIYTSHSGWVSYDPGNGGREQMLKAADDCGWGPAQVTLGSFHLMGTAHMSGSRETSVCDPAGESWDAKNLFVVDGAVLPTALGVNPMITIEAAAHKIARGLAARLT
ncbi:MAG: GMC family oxidoreductase N-terminal domain-containing protein [Solirubrobacterales bacterium]